MAGSSGGPSRLVTNLSLEIPMTCSVGQRVRADQVPPGALARNTHTVYTRIAPGSAIAQLHFRKNPGDKEYRPVFQYPAGHPKAGQTRVFFREHELEIVQLPGGHDHSNRGADVQANVAPARSRSDRYENVDNHNHTVRSKESKPMRDNKTLLLLMMSGAFNGGGTQNPALQGLLPILLLSEGETRGGGLGDDPIVLLMLMQSGVFGQQAGGGLGAILPLLLAGGEDLDTKTLLKGFILNQIGGSFTPQERQSWTEGKTGAVVQSVVARHLEVGGGQGSKDAPRVPDVPGVR